MLQWKSVSREDLPVLHRYYETCSYRLCEYAALTKFMWRGHLHPAWTAAAGCLLACNDIDSELVFDYPVPGPRGDEDAALTAIEGDCIDRGISPVISVVPEEKAGALLRRYPYVSVRNVRTWKDYLYRAEDLKAFVGRRDAGQRNHIKKFRSAFPRAEFRTLGVEDAPLIERFWQDYAQEFGKGDDPRAVNELKSAREMLKLVGEPWLLCGGMEADGRLLSLSLAERCGGTLIIHIEKGLYSCPGVYPATVQAFAQTFGQDVRWINREDDAADRGLRTSKLQYGPAELGSKYHFAPENELLTHVRAIPELKTERLTLTALREEDIPAYNALVLDADHNRWWGYDDVGGLTEPRTERSFFEVAERDFAARSAVNFAVRLDGQFIGEAVLYRFDYRGGAELGCRIAPAFTGHGYGTEAFAAVADWALYQVHLTKVVAKCFRENEPSRKMLSASMRPIGEDGTFYYFEKTV